MQLRVGNRWDSGGSQHSPPVFLNSISNPEPHRIAHDACCLQLLIDCNFPFAIVGRRDSQTSTSCCSCVHMCDRELLHRGCLLYVLWLGILYLRCWWMHSQLAQVLGSSSDLSELLQLLVLTEMILHCRSKGHCDTETCSCLRTSLLNKLSFQVSRIQRTLHDTESRSVAGQCAKTGHTHQCLSLHPS